MKILSVTFLLLLALVTPMCFGAPAESAAGTVRAVAPVEEPTSVSEPIPSDKMPAVAPDRPPDPASRVAVGLQDQPLPVSALDLSLFGIISLGVLGLFWIRRHTAEF